MRKKINKNNRSEWRSACPINISLERFGDKWSLLILRDLMFKDRHEYKDFLQAEEKIATNVLSDRLKQLESHGIIEKRPHAEDARKVNYQLSEKGMDLAPALIEMIIWAAKYENTAAPPSVVREMKSNRDSFVTGLRQVWKGQG